MKKYLSVLAVAAAVCAGCAGFAGQAAHAQDKAAAPAAVDGAKFPPAVVAVVDVQKIMRESSSAKSVRDQLATKRAEYQKMVTADEQKLREAEQALSEQKAKLSADEFAKKRTEFADKVRATQESVQARARVLDDAFNAALNEIKKVLSQITADIAASHGATVVIDRGQLLIVESSLDVTDSVLVALNKQLPSVTVKAADTPAKKK